MSEPTAAERRRSAGLAGHSGDVAAAAQAIDDVDATVRIAGLRSLARLASLHDDVLADALRDTDASERVAALEIAASRATPAVAALLTDPEPMVVECAAWALGERAVTDPAIIDALGAVARTHDDPLAREAAVAALGALGDERGLPAVLAATEDKPAIRRRAVVALAAFEGPEVDAAWARARRDRDRQVRDAVDELLGPDDEPG